MLESLDREKGSYGKELRAASAAAADLLADDFFEDDDEVRRLVAGFLVRPPPELGPPLLVADLDEGGLGAIFFSPMIACCC